MAADIEGRRAMVLGRISLYVENISQMPDITEQERRLAELKAQEKLLDQAVSADVIQQKLESYPSVAYSRSAKLIEVDALPPVPLPIEFPASPPEHLSPGARQRLSAQLP